MNLIHQLIYVSLFMMFHMEFINLHDFGVLAFITLCKAPGFINNTPL
jgi:4-amino-4-deoxy-L-arabinose transferase-like glycosyltransferase